jgi:phage terminase small subunit
MPFLKKKDSEGTKGHKLTPNMKSFIDEYLIDFNAVDAMFRSTYKTPTRNQARHMAAHIMAHPLVVEEIDRRVDKRSEKAEIKAEYLILKLMEIIDKDEGESKERTSDRLRAIELAGKAIAMWKERQEISGPDGEAIKHEQTIRENADAFTNKLEQLAQRNNVVQLVK